MLIGGVTSSLIRKTKMSNTIVLLVSLINQGHSGLSLIGQKTSCWVIVMFYFLYMPSIFKFKKNWGASFLLWFRKSKSFVRFPISYKTENKNQKQKENSRKLVGAGRVYVQNTLDCCTGDFVLLCCEFGSFITFFLWKPWRQIERSLFTLLFLNIL